MANNFSLGGRRSVVVHRQLTADDRWIPTSTSSQYADSEGAAFTDAGILAEIAGVGSSNGFFQLADCMVSVLFTGFTTADVAVQVYVPSWTGGGAWKTVIPASKWTAGEAKVIQAPMLAWRAGCVTIGADAATLYVTAWYTPATKG